MKMPTKPMGENTTTFIRHHLTSGTADSLRRAARRKAGDKVGKIDLSQLVFDAILTGAEHRHKFKGERQAVAYMRTTVVREVMAKLKLAYSRTQALGDEPVRQRFEADDGTNSPQEHEAQKREAMGQVYRLLEQLSEQEREVICRHYLLGQPYEEIAGVCGTSRDAVRQQASRAMARVRTLMGVQKQPARQNPKR